MDKEKKEGDYAPLFKLESYNAGIIDLEELIGKQKIVLIFSRYFGCPICQLDLNILLQAIDKYKIDFPVIHSSKDELYAEYGLGLMTAGAVAEVRSKLKEAMKLGIAHGEYEGWEKQGPGQFVIDEEGKIIHGRKGWLLIPEILEVL